MGGNTVLRTPSDVQTQRDDGPHSQAITEDRRPSTSLKRLGALALPIYMSALLIALVLVKPVAAQTCATEVEPNDRAAEATAVTGVTCIEGTLSGRETDHLRLAVDPALA
ncbi:hypothetical protein LCGC14_2600190, partial [marine sediment metagenome]